MNSPAASTVKKETGEGLDFDKPLIEYDPQKSSVSKDASPESYGHSGYTGTFVWVDPKFDLIYIFFSNRVYQTRENRKIYELNIRPMIHQVIYDSFLVEVIWKPLNAFFKVYHFNHRN